MRIWIALIVAPLLALTDQSVAFALVGWSCEHQTTLPLHATHGVFLALTAAATVGAALAWSGEGSVSVRGGVAERQRHFLAGLAVMIAALSALAIVAMWVPAWMISPCVA